MRTCRIAAEPTTSVIAGVDAPCRAIDASFDRLHDLQAENPTIVPLTTWKAPAAPACGS